MTKKIGNNFMATIFQVRCWTLYRYTDINKTRIAINYLLSRFRRSYIATYVIHISTKVAKMAEEDQIKYFTIEQVKIHNGKDDSRVWFIYKDSIYDVTEYLDDVSVFPFESDHQNQFTFCHTTIICMCVCIAFISLFLSIVFLIL